MSRHYDIAIVGGGFVGGTLACALAATPRRIALIESRPVSSVNGTGPRRDERSIALALASKRMFDALGVWEQIGPHSIAIRKIHISDQGRFGAMRMDCRNHESEGFGYMVPAEKLVLSLQEHLRHHENIQCIQPYKVSDIESHADRVILHGEGEPIQADLLIAADGTHSFIRNKLGIPANEKKYHQTAIVGNVSVDDDHQFTAYERFTRQGPLTLLPHAGNNCGFVWVLPDNIAQELMACTDEDFLLQLQQAFGYRLGYFSKIGKRSAFPLSLWVSQRRVQERVVLIGNAAQTLHPIGAQSLNLALRDVAELSEVLHAGDDGLDGISERLRAYASGRQSDIKRTIRLTDTFNFLFTTNDPVLSRTRGIGLALLGAIPLLENIILRQSSGDPDSVANLLQGKPPQSA